MCDDGGEQKLRLTILSCGSDHDDGGAAAANGGREVEEARAPSIDGAARVTKPQTLAYAQAHAHARARACDKKSCRT